MPKEPSMPRRAARLALILAACLALVPFGQAVAASLTGKVVRVIDGDSLVFQSDRNEKPLEVRLKDIDAPEGCQAGGEEARDFLQSYVHDKTVQLDTRGRDHYGRTLAVLKVAGVDVNQRLVAEGHAWALRVKWDRGTYVAQEKMAQALKRGLHAERGAMLPSEFRRTRGPCAGPESAASGPAGSPPAAKDAPAVVAPVVSPVADARFRCDGRTHCSHMTSCAEATFFLQNCPGVKMDGNHDGVPCERQWCNR
jgi:endonuclease YncB( thermonuclease family)